MQTYLILSVCWIHTGWARIWFGCVTQLCRVYKRMVVRFPVWADQTTVLDKALTHHSSAIINVQLSRTNISPSQTDITVNFKRKWSLWFRYNSFFNPREKLLYNDSLHGFNIFLITDYIIGLSVVWCKAKLYTHYKTTDSTLGPFCPGAFFWDAACFISK